MVVDGNKVIAYYTFRKASAAPVVKDVALYKPGTADLDSNGRVNADDAYYLLYHVNFPGTYPLS